MKELKKPEKMREKINQNLTILRYFHGKTGPNWFIIFSAPVRRTRFFAGTDPGIARKSPCFVSILGPFDRSIG